MLKFFDDINKEKDEINLFRKECFEEIKNNEEFYSLILKDFTNQEIEDNIAKFYRYYNDFILNKKLKDYEDCKKENVFFRYIVTKIDGKIVEKQKEIDAYHQFIYYYNHFVCCDFDVEKYYKLELKNIPRQELSKQIKDRFKARVNIFYIHGGPSTFKTSSAIAMSNGYIKNKNYQVCFLSCYKRFKELIDLSFSKNNDDKALYNDKMNDILNIKVLVLDGLGEEYKNEYLRDSLLLPILRERSKNKNLITIITSDYSLDDLINLYILKDKNTVQANLIKEIILSGAKAPIFSGNFSI